jgi:dephospho-CoA kinase
VEAALMIEVGTYKDYDKIVVVKCSPEVQRRRIKERSALTDGREGQVRRLCDRQFRRYRFDSPSG